MFGKSKHLNVGEKGEQVAARYLKKKGYRILQSNFQNSRGVRVGEIDIVAQEKRGQKQILFVEVKTRMVNNSENIIPEQNINRQKLFKLSKIAQIYIKKNKLWDFPYRFDAISVWLYSDQKSAKVKHLESIFL